MDFRKIAGVGVLLAVAAGLAHAEAPSRRAPTRIFIRSQLKYGLERTDFLHDWYERPLHQDSTYALRAPNGGRLINDLSWQKQVEVARLSKADGFGVFVTTRRRDEVFAQSLRPGCEIPILVELNGGDEVRGLAHCVETAGRALAAPNAFRLDGKVVLTRYPSITVEKQAPLDFYPGFKRALDEAYGPGKFALMPYVRFARTDDLERLEEPAAQERIKEDVRNILRKTDGLYYTLGEVAFVDRRYNPVRHDTLIVPLLKSVFAEKEFCGKFLGVGIRQGHENHYRWTYGIDSTGTQLLRDSLASVAKLRPDFILCPEWDEENENTQFRPITSNGHVTQRILRYWADVFANREPDVYPGDDVSIPNIVVSYRKSLQAGEPAEVEVVFVPDGTAKAKAYDVSFRWRTPDGRTARAWPSARLATDAMNAVWFNCPASELLANHVLLPELTVREASGAPRVFGDGMWPLTVEANRNIDFKWVKNALRETATGVVGELHAGPVGADGTCEVRGRVASDVPLRSVEVLDGFDTVYMHGDDLSQSGAVRIRVSRQGCAAFGEETVPGTVSLGGQTASLEKTSPSVRGDEAVFDVPAAAVNDAVVKVRLGGVMNADIPVSNIVAAGELSFALTGGVTLVAARDYRTLRIPPPCGVKTASFAFRMKPMSRLSVLRLRTIDESFRTWVSPAPVDFYRPSGETRTFHVAERTREAPVRDVTVDAARCVEADWTFDGPGPIYRFDGFREMPLVFGGSVSMVNGFGRGESSYGYAIAGSKSAPPSPRAFATFPLQTIPMYAGFEVTVRVKPADVKRPATLLSSSGNGFALSQKNGFLQAFFSTGNMHLLPKAERQSGVRVWGPRLVAGRWNLVRVCCDKRTAWIEVDGVRGKAVPCGGWQFGPLIGGLGVSPNGRDYYPGEFGSLSVKLK